MTDINRTGSYHATFSLTSTACETPPITFNSNPVVSRRVSTGGEGKGASRVPQFNAYQFRYHNEDLGKESMTASRRSFEEAPCGGSILKPFNVSFKRTLTDLHPVASSVITPEQRRTCFSGFLDKVGRAQRSVQALVSAGESRELFAMLRNPMRGIVNLTTEYVLSQGSKTPPNRRYKPSLKTVNQLNSAYLEYTFGIAPLLSDIRNSTKAYYRNRDNYTGIKRVASRVSNSSSSTTDAQGYGPTAGFNGTKFVTLRSTSRLQYLTYVSASSPMAPGESPFLRDLGLTTSDFVPSLYELIPWSFILDYFVDVGGYLNREVTITRDWQITACVSETNATDLTVHVNGGQPYPDPISSAGFYNQSYDCSPSSYKTTSGNRSVATIGQLASDPVTSNKVNSSLPGWKQALNLSSLGVAFLTTHQEHPLTSKQRALLGVR